MEEAIITNTGLMRHLGEDVCLNPSAPTRAEGELNYLLSSKPLERTGIVETPHFYVIWDFNGKKKTDFLVERDRIEISHGKNKRTYKYVGR